MRHLARQLCADAATADDTAESAEGLTWASVGQREAIAPMLAALGAVRDYHQRMIMDGPGRLRHEFNHSAAIDALNAAIVWLEDELEEDPT